MIHAPLLYVGPGLGLVTIIIVVIVLVVVLGSLLMIIWTPIKSVIKKIKSFFQKSE